MDKVSTAVRTIPGALVAPEAALVAAPHLLPDEVLLGVRDVSLPLTKTRFHHVKALDTKTGVARRFAVHGGKIKDGKRLFAAERAAHRQSYAAMPKRAFAALKDTDNDVLLWVATPGLRGKTGVSRSNLAAELNSRVGVASAAKRRAQRGRRCLRSRV
ncbi:MAG: hypothetical protein JRH20_27880 [Deltaproteobacteria bacterium]|nr:hypothetical protein [Deltaproteobacteria bacterium]